MKFKKTIAGIMALAVTAALLPQFEPLNAAAAENDIEQRLSIMTRWRR